MKIIRRINLFGGSGIGKSTIAARIYAHLKGKHKNIELVREFVKEWAWEGKKPTSYDQFYITATQTNREDILLRNGVELIVTDSPIWLGVCYGKFYGCTFWESLADIAKQFDETYPAYNVFLKRDETSPYQSKGRYQTHKESLEVDQMIIKTLKDRIKLVEMDCGDKQLVEKIVENCVYEHY